MACRGWSSGILLDDFIGQSVESSLAGIIVGPTAVASLGPGIHRRAQGAVAGIAVVLAHLRPRGAGGGHSIGPQFAKARCLSRKG